MDEMKPYFVGPDTPLEISENVRYVMNLREDREALLRVARAFDEWQRFEEKFINDPAVSLSDIDAKKNMALQALKEAEYLLD